MTRRLLISVVLGSSLVMAVNLPAAPVMGFEAGPAIYAPLGGWSKTLGAGPAFAVRVVHPWRHNLAFGAGVGFLQLRGKADRDLVYQGVPVTAWAGYRILTMRSEQEIWAWAGGGIMRSQVTLSGGKETSSDPLAEIGLSGSVPIAAGLGIALEAKYDEVLAAKEHARDMSLGVGLRYGK